MKYWVEGVDFDYYDFFNNEIRRISSEDINDQTKIYLTTMKSKELARIGLFEGTPPISVRFSYICSDGAIQSQKDVIFMHNEISVLLNEV